MRRVGKLQMELSHRVRAIPCQEWLRLPELMAPLSVYAQFICGMLLVIGLLTRWAGLLMTLNFVVAVAMMRRSQDFRGWWPAIVLNW